jgi:2-(1,2-epoxy-1,2-dihydrophenyl)acetyl-CoA isomerase
VGQDLAAVEELEHADETVAGSYNPIAQAIAGMPKPVVAAVNGLAVGAGFGLALACDQRLASDTASFSCAFSKVGLVPDTAASWYLVRELGYTRAFRLAATGRTVRAAEALDLGLLDEVLPADALADRAHELARELGYTRAFRLAATGRTVRAAEALDLGLLDEVLPADALADRAHELARELASGPALALALTKRQFRAVGEVSFEAALAIEARHQGEAAAHPDHVEGRTAFAEKRAPRWA